MEKKKSAPKSGDALLRHAASAAIFLALFLFLLNGVSEVLRNKTGDVNISTFYQEPDNTLDVLFIGTSHALDAFSPMQIYEQTGILSYNLAQSGQQLPLTYYTLQEGLRKQDPKVVVFDLYYLVKDNKYGNTAFTHQTVDNLAWSPVRLKAIADGVRPDLIPEFLFNIIAYHSRWNELKAADFTKGTNARRGEHISFVAQPAADPELLHTDRVGELSAISDYYYRRIISLCEKEGVQLLLTVVPYSVGNDNDNKSGEEQLAVFNRAFEIAGEHGIPYINYFDLIDEIGFDFETDMRDQTHINMNGSKKVNSHLAAYLKENYSLADRRGEKGFGRWETDLGRYEANLLKQKISDLPNCTSLAGCLNCLKGEEDFVSVLTLKGRDASLLTDKEIRALKDLGIRTDLRRLSGQNWLAVISGGSVTTELTGPDTLRAEYACGKTGGGVVESGKDTGLITRNGKAVSKNEDGLNIVVFSNSQGKQALSAVFPAGKADPADQRIEKLKRAETLEEYLDTLRGEEDFTVLLTLCGQQTADMTDEEARALAALGAQTDLRQLSEENWLAVLKNGTAETELTGPETLRASYTAGTGIGSLESGVSSGQITLNGVSVSKNKPGLNVAVYSSRAGEIVGSAVFPLAEKAPPPAFEGEAAQPSSLPLAEKLAALPKTDSLSEYLVLVAQEPDFTVKLALRGQDASCMTDGDMAALKACGITTDLRALSGENWLAVLKGGAAETEKTGPGLLTADYTCGKSSTGTVESSDDAGLITRNGRVVSVNGKGINIVVFSSSKGKQVDSVAFDTSSPGCPCQR